MIGFSVLLAVIINSILKDVVRPENLIYCSNVSAINGYGFPLHHTDLPEGSIFSGVPNPKPLLWPDGLVNRLNQLGIKTTKENVGEKRFMHSNYYNLKPRVPLDGNLRRTVEFGKDKKCTYWLGQPYPFQRPYAPDPKPRNPVFVRDATFRPNPVGGWLSQLNNSDYVRNLFEDQLYVWYNYSATGMKGNMNLGFKVPGEPIRYSENIKIDFSNLPSGEGEFALLETRVYLANETVSPNEKIFNIRMVPFVRRIGLSESDLNQGLVINVRRVLNALGAVDKEVLFQFQPSILDAILFIISVNRILKDLPYGVIFFQEMDTNTRKFRYIMQTGTDRRIKKMNVFPSEGFRRLIQQSQISNIISKSAIKD